MFEKVCIIFILFVFFTFLQALESFERERFRAQSAAYTALVARCNENAEASSSAAPDSAASSGSGGSSASAGGDLDLDYGVVAAADESEHRAILRLYKDLLSFYSDEESVRDTISPGDCYETYAHICYFFTNRYICRSTTGYWDVA
jgi:hypothetical protein